MLYCGEDAISKFFESLQQQQERIKTLLKEIVPVQFPPCEKEQFQFTTHCANRVRDDCHLTGQFGGAAHNACNLNFQFTGRLPVILHNLSGYDSHRIMQGDKKFKNKQIASRTTWKSTFPSQSIASLEKLWKNLAKEGDGKVHVLKRYIEESKVPLLLRKSVYPYDYMDCMDSFQEEQLPPKEVFYIQLIDKNNSDKDYQHAQTVFETFQLQNHDLYLF